MSNKILNALMAGSLANKGITFDPTRPAYILLYQNGNVGVYSDHTGSRMYVYTELSQLGDGPVKMSTRSPKGFFIGNSVNDFFDSIYENNFKLANIPTEELATLDAPADRFITNVYMYNPKATTKLEPLDPATYAHKPEDLARVNAAKAYITALVGKKVIIDATAALVTKAGDLVKAMIVRNQQANAMVWTDSGMMVLKLHDELAGDSSLQTALTALQTAYSNQGKTCPLTLTSAFIQGLAGTRWSLAMTVDLSVNPNMYLSPVSQGAAFTPPVPIVNPQDLTVHVSTPTA